MLNVVKYCGMKNNLMDVTFLITVRIDSIIRLENLLMTTRFLLRYFDCKIIVLEAAPYKNGFIKKMLNHRVEYYFIEDYDSVFYRTRYLNLIAEKVVTSYLCIWDADVIVAPIQIIEAVDKLRNNEYDVALPYDGRALDTTDIIRELFILNNRIDYLFKHIPKMQLLYSGLTLRGGAIFVTLEAYKNAGMENVAFYGWGSEDFERYDRWMILGYKIYITKGVLFHLTHPRGQNSKYSRINQIINSEVKLFETRMSSSKELMKK